MIEECGRPLNKTSFIDLDFYNPELSAIIPGFVPPTLPRAIYNNSKGSRCPSNKLLGRRRLSREGQYAPNFGDGGLIRSDLRFYVRMPQMDGEKAAHRVPDLLRSGIEYDGSDYAPVSVSFHGHNLK